MKQDSVLSKPTMMHLGQLEFVIACLCFSQDVSSEHLIKARAVQADKNRGWKTPLPDFLILQLSARSVLVKEGQWGAEQCFNPQHESRGQHRSGGSCRGCGSLPGGRPSPGIWQNLMDYCPMRRASSWILTSIMSYCFYAGITFEHDGALL